MKRSPIKRRYRVPVRDRDGERRWAAGAVEHCESPWCDGTSARLHLHHVTLRQIVQREGGDVWAPENRMTLCETCHARHHRAAAGKLPLSTLRDAHVRFAADLLGAGAAWAYFTRRYSGRDVRVERLLAEAEDAA